MKYYNSDNNLYDDKILCDSMISGHKCYNNNQYFLLLNVEEEAEKYQNQSH